MRTQGSDEAIVGADVGGSEVYTSKMRHPHVGYYVWKEGRLRNGLNHFPLIILSAPKADLMVGTLWRGVGMFVRSKFGHSRK